MNIYTKMIMKSAIIYDILKNNVNLKYLTSTYKLYHLFIVLFFGLEPN